MTWRVYLNGTELKFLIGDALPERSWNYLFDIKHDPWDDEGKSEIRTKLEIIKRYVDEKVRRS